MTPEGLRKVMGRLLAGWSNADLNPAAIAEVWLEELADFTDEEVMLGLTKAMRDPARKQAFSPSLGELISYATPMQQNRKAFAHSRAIVERENHLRATALDPESIAHIDPPLEKQPPRRKR